MTEETLLLVEDTTSQRTLVWTASSCGTTCRSTRRPNSFFRHRARVPDNIPGPSIRLFTFHWVSTWELTRSVESVGTIARARPPRLASASSVILIGHGGTDAHSEV